MSQMFAHDVEQHPLWHIGGQKFTGWVGEDQGRKISTQISKNWL